MVSKYMNFFGLNILNYLISFIFIFLIFYWSYKQEALDLKGSVFALIFGMVIWHTLGFPFFLIILSFFLLSYAATQMKVSLRGYKSRINDIRSADNVISNGLVPFFSAIMGYDFIFFGSLSAALADTLASELGILSNEKPRMITTFKKVMSGKDGAVSSVGLIVSFIAGIVMAALIVFLGASKIQLTLLMAILGVSGLFGSLFDSFLGATLERRGDLSNGSVNFISTLIGGLVAFLLRVLLVG